MGFNESLNGTLGCNLSVHCTPAAMHCTLAAMLASLTKASLLVH